MARTAARTLGAAALVIGMASCAESPVQIEDGQTLTHETLGFRIGVPEDLEPSRWEIVGDRDPLRSDDHYAFSFRRVGEAVAVDVDADKQAGRQRYTAGEWLARLRTPPAGLQVEVVEEETIAIDRWPDAVESTWIRYLPDHDQVSGSYARIVVRGDLRVEIDASVTVVAEPGETRDELVARLRDVWPSFLSPARRIADTLQFD